MSYSGGRDEGSWSRSNQSEPTNVVTGERPKLNLAPRSVEGSNQVSKDSSPAPEEGGDKWETVFSKFNKSSSSTPTKSEAFRNFDKGSSERSGERGGFGSGDRGVDRDRGR